MDFWELDDKVKLALLAYHMYGPTFGREEFNALRCVTVKANLFGVDGGWLARSLIYVIATLSVFRKDGDGYAIAEKYLEAAKELHPTYVNVLETLAGACKRSWGRS